MIGGVAGGFAGFWGVGVLIALLAFGNTPLLIIMDSTHLYSCTHFCRQGSWGSYSGLI